MHFYIDGYNLLFSTLRATAGELKDQRETLLADLSHKITHLNLDVTIVFDATSRLDDSNRSHLQDLEIVFTSHGQIADDYILSAIKHSPNPLQETVVTSDKKLAYSIRIHGGKTQSVTSFISWLNKKFEKKPTEISPQEETPSPSKKTSVIEMKDYYQQIFEERLNEDNWFNSFFRFWVEWVE